MNRTLYLGIALAIGLSLGLAGCEGRVSADPASVAPPAAEVEHVSDGNVFKVDHPAQFPLAIAGEHDAAPELNVTGVVGPDVSRNVPAVSLASGRVIEVDAKLGDEVKKGQLLYKVRSADVSGALSDYHKAIAGEQLTKMQLDRANLLYGGGAIPKSAVEIAQTAETNAQVDVETAREHLHVLGVDPADPNGIVNVFAPVSGVITDQQITDAAGVQALGSPAPFTISDLSHVWIVCDVYENDLAQVHPGEYADIHLNAYPNRVLKARINTILPILDPNLHTAKVRLEVENPGILRVGMFVTATFHGTVREKRAVVPASAILHLHDREWVYVPDGNGAFRRVPVVSGNMLPGGMQEVASGIKPGDQVVASALVLQSTTEQ
ncbi:MAG: efflux RND transporter periplasmic adaptor subunit [Bryobacteraceae bacterium]